MPSCSCDEILIHTWYLGFDTAAECAFNGLLGGFSGALGSIPTLIAWPLDILAGVEGGGGIVVFFFLSEIGQVMPDVFDMCWAGWCFGLSTSPVLSTLAVSLYLLCLSL